MESAHNILFWERKPPSDLPDIQALLQMLEQSGTGVLVLGSGNEVLFSTASFTRICANNYFKTNFNSLFRFETAEGSPDSICIKSEDNGSIEISASFIHWNGEKAALFLVKEMHGQAASKRNEALHIAMHLAEAFQLPVLFFRNDVLQAANLRATELLGIDSNEIQRTHFSHLFGKLQTEVSANAIDHLLSTVVSKANIRGKEATRQATLFSRNVLLDGVALKMVQIVFEQHQPKHEEKAVTAFEVIQMASHDLREPVRTVVNYSQLTLDKLKNGKYKQAFEYAELAASTALRMDKLLSDLRLLVSIDEQSLEMKSLSLQNVLNNALAEAEKRYDKSLLEVNLHKLPEVKGNEKLLTQLFKQLLDNAFKFRKGEKAVVDIAAEQEGDKVVICLRDNGIGIARKYKDKIFVPFQRLNRIDEYPGSGLGLAIAKKIVEKHHGKIHVESMSGTGAAFYITLPE